MAVLALISLNYKPLASVRTQVLWLNRGYEKRTTDILSVKVDPDLDPLRSDPRFQELIRRIGLP